MRWQQRISSIGDEPPINLPNPIWQVVASRGYRTKNDIENLFHPKLKDLSHPYSIDQMDIAVARLIKARDTKEKILLYGDYDLDGTPALALLHDGLTQLGFMDLMLFQPSRLKDGYGLHKNILKNHFDKGVRLVVTVDVGITDIEAVNAANDLGLDIVLTDHHLPKETLPQALAILNPNKGSCTSNLQHLCGTGVAFYLILALKMELEKQDSLKNNFDPKELLDLFALATITDMVPMVRENRVLVKHGLKQLSRTTRPGLKKLFQELGFYNKNLSSTDVAFRIAPKLNALTRLEEGIQALDVLLANDENAKKLVDEALLINQRRVLLQDKAKKIALELVSKNENSNLVWIHSKEFHPGVISLVASELMNTWGVPAFVGAVHENGRIIGSARAPSDVFNLQDILGSAEPVLTKFGGHKLAAGFEVREDKIEEMVELMKNYLQKSANVQSEGTVYYDTALNLNEISHDFMKWHEGLGPFGVQFEVPKFILKKVVVKSVRKLKGGYLKYTLEQNQNKIEAPWFSSPVEFPEGSHVDIIFEPQVSEYMGRKSIQALIHNMRPTIDS